MGELTESVKLLHENRTPVCLLIALCFLRWGGHVIGRNLLVVERLKIHSPLEKGTKCWIWEEKQMEVRIGMG